MSVIMEGRKIVRIKVSPELLGDVLHIPKNHPITNGVWHFDTNCFELLIEGPDLPFTKYGEIIQETRPVVTIDYDKDGKITNYKWDWGLK